MVAVYSRTDPGGKVVGFAPLRTGRREANIRRCAILQNTGDDVTLEVSFSVGNADEALSAVFSIDKTPVVEIRPSGKMDGISLLSFD